MGIGFKLLLVLGLCRLRVAMMYLLTIFKAPFSVFACVF